MMETIENQQYNKMINTTIWKLILSLSIPTTISMLITNIYNMADTYFVSQISVSASGATGIVFALMAIFQAFGFMFGHGAGSNISRNLGQKRVDIAKMFCSTSFFLALFFGLFISVFGLIFIEPLMKLLGSTATILNDAKAYGFFILISGPAMTTSCVMNNILRYEGKATFAMIGLTFGGILNMFLDPILIFGLHLGVAGAGLSTAISQYLSAVILMIPFLTGKTVTKINLHFFTHDFNDIANIIVTGFPSLVRQGLNSLSTSVLNNVASVYEDEAIAAMGIVSRCGNLLFSCALGLGQGYQPVCAFNYGAKKYERVKKGFWFTITLGICVLIAMCSICFMYSSQVIQLFRKDVAVVSIGSAALRYMCIFLPVLPLSGISSMLFQSIGKSGRALFIACLQSGFIFIPLLFILPRFLGLTGIELSLPLSYVFAGTIAIILAIKFLKQLSQEEIKNESH